MIDFRKYNLAHSKKIPDDVGGIYIFKLRFPSPYDFGIGSNLSLEAICENIFITCNRYITALKQTRMKCSSMNELDKAKNNHLREFFQINVSSYDLLNTDLVNEFKKKIVAQEIDISEFIKFLDMAFSATQPLYIGMCYFQSLQERFLQHKCGNTPLRKRLKEINLFWNDLEFYCKKGTYMSSAQELQHMERFLQNMFKPILCIK